MATDTAPLDYDDIIITASSTQHTLKGDLHRLDGPAFISAQGDERWHQFGLLHREDGPAIISRNGATQWWVRGTRIPQP